MPTVFVKAGREIITKDARFKANRELLARLVRSMDSLNRDFPGCKFFRIAESGLEQAAQAFSCWQRTIE
jgi:hypothetical protein